MSTLPSVSIFFFESQKDILHYPFFPDLKIGKELQFLYKIGIIKKIKKLKEVEDKHININQNFVEMRMRVFVAIELSEKKKEHFLLVKKNLEKVNEDVKWIKREAMHITLKFLGEVSKDKVEEIKNNLTKTLQGFGSFILKIKGIGFFPNSVKPRIIWIGIEEAEKLKRLCQVVEDICFLSGVEREKRDFVAHLTLGRIRSLKKKDELIQKIKKFDNFSFGKIVVKEVSLMESRLFSHGAKHICLEKTSL